MEAYFVITHDWKEPVDVNEINEACQKIVHPVFTHYDNEDGSDTFLYIIANRALSEDEARKVVYDHWEK
jgi:hypothetical protein